ncbi:MAG: DNA-processing protein DprA [Candidatus Levybacteria bacterium]|nr:DNA-processing protein DprA [Candidatus Levybacteria bacterium]
MKERFYWLAFSAFPGVGPAKFKALLANFGSAKEAWSAGKEDLEKVLGKALTPKLEEFRNNFSIEGYAKVLEKKKVWFITRRDKEYPKSLLEIKNPPIILFGKGQAEILHFVQNDKEERAIAVVGTRKITQYGRDVTKLLTEELVMAGFTIVSGLAAGVDSVAHQTAIDCGGKTIAVLGCGVDICIPPQNQALYNSIISGNGVIVSELPLSHPPTKGSFPSRNRIIAGLSQAVLVTEGAEDSGALITADYAFKNHRKVFAVPGPITSSLSKGPYKLISKGAKLVTNARDIIDELGIDVKGIKGTTSTTSIKGRTKISGASEEENRILEILENEPLHFDAIARILKLDSSKTASILSIMEIKGMVKSLETGFFSLV